MSERGMFLHDPHPEPPRGSSMPPNAGTVRAMQVWKQHQEKQQPRQGKATASSTAEAATQGQSDVGVSSSGRGGVTVGLQAGLGTSGLGQRRSGRSASSSRARGGGGRGCKSPGGSGSPHRLAGTGDSNSGGWRRSVGRGPVKDRSIRGRRCRGLHPLGYWVQGVVQ